MTSLCLFRNFVEYELPSSCRQLFILLNLLILSFEFAFVFSLHKNNRRCCSFRTTPVLYLYSKMYSSLSGSKAYIPFEPCARMPLFTFLVQPFTKNKRFFYCTLLCVSICKSRGATLIAHRDCMSEPQEIQSRSGSTIFFKHW